MTTPLQVGIIGLGVGEGHIAGYHRHPACAVTALCDFDPERAEKARRDYPGLRVTTRAEDILEDPDIAIVSVASFDNFHHDQVTAALRAGKHVFAEKPLCLNARELASIRKELDARPHLRLSSNLILRMSPRFRELRADITRGDYGEVYYLEGDYNYGRLHKITTGWRGRIPFYSVVHGGAVHLVDLMLWLTGKRVERVAAFGTRIASQGTAFAFNDTVAAVLRFSDGSCGKVSSNYACVYPHFHKLAVYGTRMTFENGQEEAVVYMSRDPGAEPRRMRSAYPGVHKGDLVPSFVESIVSGTPAEVEAEEVFTAMSVCLAIEESARLGRELDVTYF